VHQPHNLAAIEAVCERLPAVPQVACFDTSFHRGRDAVTEVVPLPLEVRRAGVQRYGFHGLSYEYIASVLPQLAPEGRGAARHHRAPGSGAKPVRRAQRTKRRHHVRVHRARRAL
jgi:acetate kinase